MARAVSENMIFNFITGKNTTLESLQQIEKKITDIGTLSAKKFIDTNKSQAAVQRLTKRFPELEKSMVRAFDRGKARANSFNPMFLSLIFSGMALQRTFGGLFRVMSNVGSKIEETTTKGERDFVNLTASVEFFKFSIFDALTSTSLFSNFVTSAIGAITTVSNLLQNEKTAELILEISSVGFIVGAGLGVLGLVAQVGQLLIGAFPSIFVGGQLASGFLGITIAVGAVMTLKSIGKLASAIGDGDVSDIFTQILNVISGALITAGAITALSNPATGAIILTIGIGLRFVPYIWERIKQAPEKLAEGAGAATKAILGIGTSMQSSFTSENEEKITRTKDETSFLTDVVNTLKDIALPNLITRNKEVADSYDEVAEAANRAAAAQARVKSESSSSNGSLFWDLSGVSSITSD